LTFDPVAAAQAAADLSSSLLFQPERAARLLEYHARDAANPGLEEVIDAVAAKCWLAPLPKGLAGQVQQAVSLVAFQHVLALAADTKGSPVVSSAALAALRARRTRLPAWAQAQLAQLEKDPKEFRMRTVAEAPPGQPIGQSMGMSSDEDDCVRLIR
jgi:hypothetical protein